MNTALGSLLSRPYYDAALSSFATCKRKRCDFRRAESPGWVAINRSVGQPCAKMPRVRNLILFTETLSKKNMKKARKCLGLSGFRGLWPLAGVAGILFAADFVFQVEDAPGTPDQTECLFHCFTHVYECDAVGDCRVSEQWASGIRAETSF